MWCYASTRDIRIGLIIWKIYTHHSSFSYIRFLYLPKQTGGSVHWPNSQRTIWDPSIMCKLLHLYSTVEPDSYTGCAKAMVSPLSIKGGGPHFPAASKSKYRNREYLHQRLFTVNTVRSQILHNTAINILWQSRKNPKGNVKKSEPDIGTEHKRLKVLSL